MKPAAGSATLNDGSACGGPSGHLPRPPGGGISETAVGTSPVRRPRTVLVHYSKQLRYLMLDIEISVA